MNKTHRKNLEQMLKSNSVPEILVEMAGILEEYGYGVLPIRLRNFAESQPWLPLPDEKEGEIK